MNNTRRIWAVCSFFILCFIAYAIMSNVVISSLETKLADSQATLSAVQEELSTTHDMLAKEMSTVATLQSELDTANEVALAINSEEWVLNGTATEYEINMLAKTVWGEARGCSKLEQAAVVWCILNRVDAGRGTIAQVITAENQFHGYNSSFPVTDDIRELVEDVVTRWKLEKISSYHVGRVLPSNYLYFVADGTGIGNIFKTSYTGPAERWNWDCFNPYK